MPLLAVEYYVIRLHSLNVSRYLMLTQQQRKEFFERGFTRVGGALPQQLAATTVARIWKALEMRQDVQCHDPNTWIEGGVRGIGDLNREPEFRPFGSLAIMSVIDDLLGKDKWRHARY